ncbi:mitochondrial carrier domain-containing protein [Cyathus striatus]|nr:mitochondrial carrier domain-containing protein [Cyathus striatus]
MTHPSSLRDLYIHPSSVWDFVPTNAPPPPLNTTIPHDTSAPTSYQWSTRPSRNSLFDLSPSLDHPSPEHFNFPVLLKDLLAAAAIQYSSTALVMPWEVGKLLLQVQWVPKDAGEPDAPEQEPADDENEDALSDSSSNDDSYFLDPSVTVPRHPVMRTDEQGYVLRRSVLEEGTRPEYIIPVGTADGVWDMMKRVGRFRSEGWLSLWKGLFTSCITEVVSMSFQPFLHSFLQSLFFPSMSPFHQPPVFIPVISHVITGFLLSPLDLVRTRLIVQSGSSRYRTYTGPFDALRQILRDEGGLRGIYLHPHLLIPTIFDNAVQSIVSLTFPGMVASYFGANISEDTHPLVWNVAELGGMGLGLLVNLPFETVRRRLQVQTRGSAKPIKGCVELRPAPYNGIVDTFWHVLTEERSDLPIMGHKRRPSVKGKEKEETTKTAEEEYENRSWFRHTGIGQLYRGFSMRLGAGIIVVAMKLLEGRSEPETGWAEI